MVPVITKAAASLPQMEAISRSKLEVVWSSPYTSSFRVARLIASSMPTEGVVITSPVMLVRFGCSNLISHPKPLDLASVPGMQHQECSILDGMLDYLLLKSYAAPVSSGRPQKPDKVLSSVTMLMMLTVRHGLIDGTTVFQCRNSI